MKKKPLEKGPVLKRDEHNQLDKNHADEVLTDLTKNLIETERDFQKDNAMRKAMTNKRDIVVKTVIYLRNTVNGHLIQEDATDPQYEKFNDNKMDPLRYRYVDHIDGELFVRDMPMSMAKVGQWSMGMFKALINYLCQMGVFNRI